MPANDSPIPFPCGLTSSDSDTKFIKIVEGSNYSSFLLARVFILPYLIIFLMSMGKLAKMTRSITNFRLFMLIYGLILLATLIRLSNLFMNMTIGSAKHGTVFPGVYYFKSFSSPFFLNAIFLPDALLIIIQALVGLLL